MSRVEQERDYWNKAASDPDVDIKYICDIDTKDCVKAIGRLRGKVLEIGCGVGRLMQPGYYGIDISEEMLKIAKVRLPGGHYALTDGRVIPYDDENFDTVYSMLVFQHLPVAAVKNYISETYRVLKPKGSFRFQFVEGNEQEPFSFHYPREEMERYLNEIGFTIKSSKRGLLHDHWVWITVWK